MKRRRAARVAGLAAALFAAVAAAEEGVVVDARTGRPLEGVYVVARWRGDKLSPVQAARGCYRVQLASTAADGRYRVEFPGRPTLRPREIAFYKPGYRVEDAARDAAPTPLRPFAGTFMQRFAEYGSVWGRDCPDAGRVLRPMLEAMAAEAERLARTTAEREKAAGMRFELDVDIEGLAAANQRYEARVRQIREAAKGARPKAP